MATRIDFSLYAIIDEAFLRGRDPARVAAELASGGVSVVQYRAKKMPSPEFLPRAIAILGAVRDFGIPFIVNDRVDVALLTGADGVHLGSQDMPVARARQELGSDRIIGVSVCNLQEVAQAESDGADYLGAGAVFATATKSGAPVIGLGTLALIKAAASVPVVAIGGLTPEKVEEVVSTGVDGLAFISGLMDSPEPAEAARRLRSLIDVARLRQNRNS